MNLYPIIRDAWGQLRGYRRWTIRREVASTMAMSAESLALHSRKRAYERFLRAIKQFPAYAERVHQHTSRTDIEDLPFEQLPILTKSDLTQILSTVYSPLSPSFPPVQNAIPHSTGGSTGQPFSFYITRESYEWRTAVSDRGYGWAQAEEGQRSFYVWGSSIRKPGWKQRVKEGLHHWLQNRYYFDSFLFDDEQKERCCKALNRFKPSSIVGYAGNLIELARFVERRPDVISWRARTCVTAAEGLRPGMRELIEKHLADEVFMSYGSREFMLIGMEGPDHDGYCLSADNLFVEVVDDAGKPCEPGQVGRIVVTDLHNDATPFVRYEIGDVGSVACKKSKEDTFSTHPRLTSRVPRPTPYSFPRLAAVEGRLQEVIVQADGEKLTALFIPHLMKEFDWVEGYQVAQDMPGVMTVNLVTRDEAWQGKTNDIERLLRTKLGCDMQITFARVDQLEKTAGGKTPIVVSRLMRGG